MWNRFIDALGPLALVGGVSWPLLYAIRKFHQWKMRNRPRIIATSPIYRPTIPITSTKSHARK